MAGLAFVILYRKQLNRWFAMSLATLILLLVVKTLHQIPHPPNVQDLRLKFIFRQLWTEILTRTPNKTTCLPLSYGDIKTVHRGIIALNVTRGEMDSLIFYKTHSKAVGMRASFAFLRKINRNGIMAHILAIVDVRPTGQWHLFNLCRCNAKNVSRVQHDFILHA